MAVSLTSIPIAAAAEPPPTPATDPSDSDLERGRELFGNGKSLYLDASYDAAIAAFKQAYALTGDPVLLYNIAQSYDRAQKIDEAIEYLEYYRAFAPASERDALEERVSSLQRRKVKAQADAAENAPPEDSDGAGNAGGSEREPSDRTTRGSNGGSTDEVPPLFGPVAIALTAVAGVGLGVGLGLGVTASRRSTKAQDMCADSPLVCPADAQTNIDSSRRLALGADIAFGIGAAAAVGAIVVIAVNASKRKQATTAGLGSRVAVGAHHRGASLSVRF